MRKVIVLLAGIILLIGCKEKEETGKKDNAPWTLTGNISGGGGLCNIDKLWAENEIQIIQGKQYASRKDCENAIQKIRNGISSDCRNYIQVNCNCVSTN